MPFDNAHLPFIPARWFKPVAGPMRRVRVIVIHDMEADETQKTAESVANYFKRGEEAQASAHYCIDNVNVIQCVHDRDVAFAAPGCNSDGIQLELAGYGNQTGAQWADAYSSAVIANAADIAAQMCIKFAVPAIHLTNAELAAGKSGIIGHYQASAVYKKSDHQDPGAGFPWEGFIKAVATRVAALKCKP